MLIFVAWATSPWPAARSPHGVEVITDRAARATGRPRHRSRPPCPPVAWPSRPCPAAIERGPPPAPSPDMGETPMLRKHVQRRRLAAHANALAPPLPPRPVLS